MRRPGFVAAAVVLASGLVAAQGAVESHTAAARAAAGRDFGALLDRLCTPPPAVAPAAPPPAGASPPAPPPRDGWYAEPVKVFDNLYFVGEKEYSAWAVVTSDGVVVIDPVFDYSVEEAVVNGLKKLGVDPARIRYVLVSHAHRDHVGGARLLQERFKARVAMTADDWDLLASDPGRWPKPTRDVVLADGQAITLGDTTLTVHATPGHTLGTVSTILPVKDGGRTHVAALWGGTNFNWMATPARYITPARQPRFWFDQYIASARKFRDVARKAGADVLLSNHTNYDGTKIKVPALAARRSGEPHPYVVGAAAVSRFLTVAEECALAGRARLES
jgi:metallo-beta-lactamase class B